MGGIRRLRLVAAGTVLVCVAGCGGGGDDPEATPSTTPANGSPTAKPDNTPVADPEHAVDPPGKRKDPLASADLLVFSPERPLDEEMVQGIEALKGVQATNLFSMGQPVIENRALTVAAVDPATYRLFTPAASANTQEVWDRVAGGELALSPELRRKVPTDDNDFIRLGSADDAPQVHIGYYAPQVESAIDAVVNDTWAEDLGLQPGNALLISTGGTSPQSLRKPIAKLVGGRASIQELDVVAREGLDIHAKQTAFVVGTVADAVGVFNYTVIGGGRIAPDPAWERTHIATEQVPILGAVRCNKLMLPQLRAALQEITDQGLADEIHPGEYAGCYYPRFIAGTTTLSNHSFGLALDLNVPGNQRGTVGEMDRQVVSIFKKWGFAWGGDWNYTDPMHFEMDELVTPR
ncbi:MAG: M15 family metallopeptidase [Nocardioides sp.]